jgi:hypothetical protein
MQGLFGQGQPTTYGWQTRGQSPLNDIVLLYLAAKLVL